MNKYLTLFLICCCYIILLKPYYAIANNAAAGEISYEWVSDSTYRFYFKFYRDCSGNAEPSTVPLCFHNPCNPAQSFSITLSKTIATGAVITTGCYRGKTKCDSAASIFPGHKEWIYSELATLPSRCNAWHIFTYIANRNKSTNIQNPTTKAFYADARFNNTGSFRVNSSPYCTKKPIIYTAWDIYYHTYNSNATDPDGDSLVTEVINPLTGVNNCIDTVGTNVTYTSPSINIPNNPFQTGNTFKLTPATGELSFYSSDTAINTAALKISEYRNGMLVGSITREIQIQQLHVQYVKMSINVPGSNGLATAIRGCPNVPLNFSWQIMTSDTNSILWATNDFATKMPGCRVTYTNQFTDTVIGTVSWTPTATDKGLIYIKAIAIDSLCRPSGYLQEFSESGLVAVADTIMAVHDTTICLGSEIYLYAFGGDYDYYWQELPNGKPGTMSCTNCNYLKVRPNANAKYVVTSGLSCPPVLHDTITVNANTNLTYPYITVAMDPLTDITPATKINFTATAFNCSKPRYKWYVNNQELVGITGTTYSRSGLAIGDKVSCELICDDSCSMPRKTIFDKYIDDGTMSIQGFNTSAINVYPNPNHGSFTLSVKLPDDQYRLEILNTLGQTVYRKNVSVHNNELKENIQLDVPAGVYLLKLNNDVIRFTIGDH